MPPLRLTLAASALSLATALPTSAQPTPPTQTSPRKPNVILILADDLGYADIGAQNISKDVRTPNIDSLAKDGVRFTNAYVSCPVCSPTRAGLLTGRYQQRFGFEANPAPAFDGTFGLPLDQTTLPAEFKRTGYATAAFGKWHLGAKPDYQPHKRGFDEFFGFLGGAHPYNRIGTGDNALRRNDAIAADEKDYLTDAISREAASFVARHKADPFFLYVAYNSVHTPQEAPRKYVDRFKDVKDEKRRLMLAMLAALDDGVGQILTQLRDNNLEENTLVIFHSDNGGPTHGNASLNTPLRGFKGEVYEGGIRIPMIAQWKSHIPPGQTIDHPVSSLDLFPTTLAAAGLQPRPELKLDGVNLLPFLQDKQSSRPHETLYWRFQPQWAIRDGDLKLLTSREGGPMLFDLAKDPAESNDLAQSRPDDVKRLRAKYDAWNRQLAKPLWPGRQEGAAATRQAPRARKPAPASDPE